MAIQAILPGQDTLARTQIAQLVIRVSQGEHWTAASTAVGIVWAQFRVNLSRSAAFRELWHAAEDAGEEWRKADLEAVTWDRARHGWLEPVHYKGKECGHVLKFSDRLAEIHLRASNPARFAPSPGESGGTQAQTIIIHLDAPQVRPAIPTASTEIDAQAIPSGNQPPPDTSKGQ